MDWFKKFMMGRYGGDQLSMVLIILAALLAFAAQVTDFQLLTFISYLPLGTAVFRTLSRNVAQRSLENYKFAILVSPIYSWFQNMKNRYQDAKIHRYYLCPNCRQRLRLPRGKGKIIIICPKCKTEFKGKT